MTTVVSDEARTIAPKACISSVHRTVYHQCIALYIIHATHGISSRLCLVSPVSRHSERSEESSKFGRPLVAPTQSAKGGLHRETTSSRSDFIPRRGISFLCSPYIFNPSKTDFILLRSLTRHKKSRAYTLLFYRFLYYE